MISRDTIARVRDRADIVAVVGDAVKLTRRGRHFLGLCPFHKEKTPSFTVNQENGRYYCFGCRENGSVIDFVMKLEGLEFPDAVRALAERVGIELEERSDQDLRAVRDNRRARLELFEFNGIAAAYFEAQLRDHPSARVAREELARRGLQSGAPTDEIADALQSFRVGYAPPGWDNLLEHLRKQGVSASAAETLGLIAPRRTGSGHYDFFRNRLVFAILDVQGRVAGFSARVLPDPETGELDKNTGKYINSPESPVYKKGGTVFGLFQAKQAIRETGVAVVVEGNFDVVALHARGMRNVVAPLGTAFTAAQASVIRRYSPHVVLLFDGDTAGREAAKKSREPCREAGLEARVAVLPPGSDPDDFVRVRGSEALKQVIGNARSLLEYLIEQVLDESFPKSNPHEQAARVREVTQLLATEDDPTVRTMARTYADNLASRLNIADARSVRALEMAIRRAVGGGTPERVEHRRVRSSPREDMLPLEMLGCVLEYPEILDDPDVQSGIDVLDGEIALAVGLARNVRSQPSSAWEETFLAHLPASIHDFAAQRLARPRLEEAEKARSEFLHNAQKLKRRAISREHAQVVRDIDQAGARGDVHEENALLLEAVRRQQEKHRL